MHSSISLPVKFKEKQADNLILLSVIFLGITTITLRDFIPYDETRYISVAWEMWQGNNFFIPHINGNIYADKPPLLFWLINLGWYMTGVNEWWPRSIPFIFSIINLYLTRYIALQLWPEIEELKKIVPVVLIAMPLWLIYSTPMMFEMLQVCFVLIAISGILHFHKKNYYGVLLFGAAAGMGILLKGPVIFIYILPAALTLPLWDRKYTYGYNKLLLQITGGLLLSGIIVSVWIIPVIQSLGLEQVKEIFWHQTADRVIHASSHSRPLWWYLYFLPLILFPWFYDPGFIRGIAVKPGKTSPQILFCMLWILPSFILFSLVDAKQLHYLLPLLPALAMIIAYKLARHGKPGIVHYRLIGIIYISLGLIYLLYKSIYTHTQQVNWIFEIPAWWSLVAIFAGLLLVVMRKTFHKYPVVMPAMVTLIFMFSIYICVLLAPRPFTSIDYLGHVLARLQKNNFPLANIGTHREQFEFAGRLNKPLDKIEPADIESWALNHPEGYLVAKIKASDGLDKNMKIIYKQPYRFKHMLLLISSKDILANKINHDQLPSSGTSYRFN